MIGSLILNVVTFAYWVVPVTIRLPVTVRLVSVPTLVIFGWALVVTVPAVLAVLAEPSILTPANDSGPDALSNPTNVVPK